MKTQRFSLVLTLFNVGVLVVILFFAAKPHAESFDKISVREFELLDKDGKKRSSIKVEDSGEMVFRMMDNTGTIRIKLGASQEGSGFVLLDDQTNPGIHALAQKKGTSFTLIDKDGKKRAL